MFLVFCRTGVHGSRQKGLLTQRAVDWVNAYVAIRIILGFKAWPATATSAVAHPSGHGCRELHTAGPTTLGAQECFVAICRTSKKSPEALNRGGSCMYVCVYIYKYVMLCYVMLCYVVLCYVMLCYVMLCYVMLCYVMYIHTYAHEMFPHTYDYVYIPCI